jgi:hypothetical protein
VNDRLRNYPIKMESNGNKSKRNGAKRKKAQNKKKNVMGLRK